MKIWIITLFPEFFGPLLNCGVVSQVFSGKRGTNISINLVNPRNYSSSNYKGVDDSPYGGGPGMIIRADILKNTLLEGIVSQGSYGTNYREKLHIIYTGPRGKVWNKKICQQFAEKYYSQNSSQKKDLVFICGRYEGVDERFITKYVNEEFSIGDFVLTGGELAVMAIIDSSLRFIPGTLGNSKGPQDESFENNLLEHPQYTRPFEFEGLQVPEILLSGHHANIKNYLKEEKIRITKKYRPDLLSSR